MALAPPLPLPIRPEAMTNNKRETLSLLIDLSRRARDHAAAEVAKAVRLENRERETMLRLTRFQDDYREASPKRAGQETGARQIETHRLFTDRLDGAVQDQRERELQATRVREQSEVALSLTERRIKALERFQQKKQLALYRREEQRAQRITDEQAALLARRSRKR